MTQIAVSEALDGKSAEWMEMVGEEQQLQGTGCSTGQNAKSRPHRDKVRRRIAITSTVKIHQARLPQPFSDLPPCSAAETAVPGRKLTVW